MGIQRASEDTTTTTTYASMDTVKKILPTLAPDIDGEPLADVFSDTELTNLEDVLLPAVKEQVDRKCGRNFDKHTNVDIEVDGNGEDVLDLAPYGFVPLTGLSSLSINSTSYSTSDFKIYRDGRVSAPTLPYKGVSFNQSCLFPTGIQNVDMTITWGYDSVPADIKLMTAALVGLHLLGQIPSATFGDDASVGGEWERIEMGETTITRGRDGRYSNLVRYLQKVVRDVQLKYRPRVFSSPRPDRSIPRSSSIVTTRLGLT